MNIVMVLSVKGFHWDEALIPYNIWSSHGWNITVATPDGAVPLADPNSIVVRPWLQLLGYGTSKQRAISNPITAEFQQAITTPMAIAAVNPTQFDAIYLVGGHGCLFDLHDNVALSTILVTMIEARKPIAAICHATSVLAHVTGNDGHKLLSHHVMTGFPTMLEYFLLLVGWVHKKFRPLPIWTGHILGTNVRRPIGLRIIELINLTKIVISDHIITGVGPKAAASLANGLMEIAGSKSQR
jgi:putative intracellular protease/amidase